MLTSRLLEVAAGGAEWVLWLLLILSVCSIAITVERWFWFRKRQCDVLGLGSKLTALLRKGDNEEASKLLAKDPSEEARIVGACLEWLDAGPEAVREVLSSTISARRKRIEQGMTFLGTLGNNAPFIGLFGTVLGVIEAFRELSNNTMGSIGGVMSGIGEALVATAVGILVALPAVVAYNLFAQKIAALEENANALVDLVNAATRSRS